MDPHDRTLEGWQSDPSPEWAGPGPQTGLEEGVWQLRPGKGESGYPERPEEADCIYYLRNGSCGYGSGCRFNHPRDRLAVVGAARAGPGQFPERVGQPVCQYYMRTGKCKFGASCKYHHPKQGGGSLNKVSLNYQGYPLRRGEKECTYYVKTGHCKFGATCKFHHPQSDKFQIEAQSSVSQVAPLPAPVPATALYPTVQSPSAPSSQQYGLIVARPPLLPGSYVQGPYGPMIVSPGLVPYPSWNSYPAPMSPLASPSTPLGVGSGIYGITQLSPSTPAYTGAYQAVTTTVGFSGSSMKESLSFPQRPGQPECQYYMKTGNCKFGSSCRYHHPLELVAQTNMVLSSMGLPLRPFGPLCRFDHPIGSMGYSPSTSSHPDMPVAPYPVGSSTGILAPPSSSSELQPNLISALSNDSTSTRMSSSMSTSSGLVGSIFSKISTGRQSSQSSGLSTGGSSSRSRESPSSS